MYASNGNLIPAEEENTTINKYPKLVEFEEKFRNTNEDKSLNIQQKLQTAIKKKVSKCSVKRFVIDHFPIIETFSTYPVKEYLPNDLVAGLIAGVMMIPQGMAFAALSTLPPIVGLYISFFASVTYFFFGTGRQLSWGCIAILSLMIANILEKYDSSVAGGADLICNNASGVPEANSTFVPRLEISTPPINASSSNFDAITRKRMEVASGVSVLVGLVLAFASRIGLSHVTALMSDSLITGFTVGVSFHVATSQFKTLLGISVPRYKGPAQLIRTWITILKHIAETNVATLIISFICMLVIYLVKRHINERFKKKLRIPIPIELFVVIAATFASFYGYFNRNYGVTIVEDIPTGVPAPKFPDITLVTDYIGDALVIIIVSYAQSLAMAKTMGLKHNYAINVPQEMLACGLCTLTCGLFSGYITGASVSRSVVQDGAGGKTQIASLFAAGLVLLVIMVIGPYFYYLPKCVLSAIIVINLRTMFLKLLDIPKEWRKSKYDCSIWVFTCIATIILNADVGLLAGVIFSLFLVVFRSMIRPIVEAGQIQTSAFAVQLRSLKNYSSAQKLNNVRIFQVKTPLFFINSEIFSNALLKIINKRKSNVFEKEIYLEETPLNANIEEVERTQNGRESNLKKIEDESLNSLKVIILDLSEVAFIDNMGVKALELLIQQSYKVDVVMLFTNIPESIFSILQSTGFWKKHADLLFQTVEDALSSLAEAVVVEDNQISRL